MAARTAITPIALIRDGGVSAGAGTAVDATNGMTVAAPGPYKVLIRVDNGDTASHTVTLRAGGSGVTASGGAAVAVPFTNATVGDLVVTVANAGSQIIEVDTTGRFTQADGSLSLDFSAATAMKVWVFQLPYVAA